MPEPQLIICYYFLPEADPPLVEEIRVIRN